MKEQLRILNENFKRESELCMTRERENKTLTNENKMLQQLFDQFRQEQTTHK